MTKQFDYSVIATPMTYEQARMRVKEIPRFYKNILFVFGLLALILVVQAIVLEMYKSAYLLLILIVPYTLIGVYFYYKFRKEIRQIATIQTFAEANDMVSFHDAPLVEPYPGSLFNDGHTRYVTTAVRTKGDDDTIEIGNYRYVTGHGRGARTHEFTYLLIKLDKQVPHIFIDSKSNNRNRLFYRNHASDYSRSQKLTLEGDFNSYFTVLVPDEYGRDATYILTPDVLQALIQYGKEYDFEMMGDTLLMFKHGHADLSDVKALETILSKATLFAAEFRKQTKFYTDERAAEGDVGTVASGGQKLRGAFPWFLVIIIGYFVVSFLTRMFF